LELGKLVYVAVFQMKFKGRIAFKIIVDTAFYDLESRFELH